MLEERIVYRGRGVCTRERWEMWSLPRGHVLLGGPDVLGGGFGEDVRPVRACGTLDRLEVAQLGKPGQVYCVIRGVFLNGARGFVVFLEQRRQ